MASETVLTKPFIRALLLAAKVDLCRLGTAWPVTDWTAMHWLFAGRPDPGEWRPACSRWGRPTDPESRGSEVLPEKGVTRSQAYVSRSKLEHVGLRGMRVQAKSLEALRGPFQEMLELLESGGLVEGSDDLASILRGYLK